MSTNFHNFWQTYVYDRYRKFATNCIHLCVWFWLADVTWHHSSQLSPSYSLSSYPTKHNRTAILSKYTKHFHKVSDTETVHAILMTHGCRSAAVVSSLHTCLPASVSAAKASLSHAPNISVNLHLAGFQTLDDVLFNGICTAIIAKWPLLKHRTKLNNDKPVH